MLKLKNLQWLFNKNTTVASMLMSLVIAFAFYMNYESITSRLSSNTRLVSSYIESQFNQYKTRLELTRQLLKITGLKDLQLGKFTSVYYLDEYGNVVASKSQDPKDRIDRFVDINKDSFKGEMYTSNLVFSKELSPSIYLAIELNNQDKEFTYNLNGFKASYLCARVGIDKFLDGVVTLDAQYLVTDGDDNVIYSSAPEISPSNVNLGDSENSWLIEGLFEDSRAIYGDSLTLSSGFNIRSFVSKDEFYSSTFIVSMVLVVIFVLFCYNIYLDKKILKIGLLDQLNYCLTLFNSRNLSDHQHHKTLAVNDVLDLQKQVAKSLINSKILSDEYNELEQRLGSMFSKSSIPMLMIDAFTAKIFKANQAALEFYNQKTVGITKMNLYMLSGKDTKEASDPVVLAGNIQNCIKNQGNYIQAHHFIHGVHKEVKIYPFVMRSERFCYDTLMILDSNLLSKNMDYLNMRSKALENSFICYLNLFLDGSKVVVNSSSKGLSRFLGISITKGTKLKALCHSSCIPQLAKLALKIRELKISGNLQQYKTYETVLFLKQADGNYSEFKVNFIVAYAKGLKIVLTAYLAHIRSDLSEFEVQTAIDYHDIYNNARELIAILSEQFEFLSVNASLKELIGNKTNLRQVISKRTMGAINSIKVGGQVSSYVELLDTNDNVHHCKFKYIASKTSKGETVYCAYFQEDFYVPMLEEFSVYLKDKGNDIEEDLCEFYEKKSLNPVMINSGLNVMKQIDGFDKAKAMLRDYLKVL